jgi:hypothetical protein
MVTGILIIEDICPSHHIVGSPSRGFLVCKGCPNKSDSKKDRYRGRRPLGIVSTHLDPMRRVRRSLGLRNPGGGLLATSVPGP